MTIQELLQQPDGTEIQEITLTVNSVNEPRLANSKSPSWGREWFAQCFDSTGKIGVVFKLKKDKYDPISLKGKTVRFTAWKNNDGQWRGLKIKESGQYKNLQISDAADHKISEGVMPATTTSHQNSSVNNRSVPAYQPINPEQYAKHLATEWCQVFDWTHEIFETRLPKEMIRECVTGIVIEMRRNPAIQILPPADRIVNWKDFVFKGVKLSELPVEKLKNGYVLCLQGAIKNPDAVAAFTAAFKDMDVSHRSVYGHWINKEGIDDDTSNEALQNLINKDDSTMSEDDFRDVLSNKEFFEECKKIQASKSTPFDDEATSLD